MEPTNFFPGWSLLQPQIRFLNFLSPLEKYCIRRNHIITIKLAVPIYCCSYVVSVYGFVVERGYFLEFINSLCPGNRPLRCKIPRKGVIQSN